MDLTKKYLFRVSAVYAAREVFDNVLYPEASKNVYEKTMPVAQAILNCDTCRVEVFDGTDKWYPVTETTMELVIDAIDADKEPTIPATTEDIPVTIPNYFVTYGTTEECSDGYVGGKFGDIKLEDNGKVSGTLFKEDFPEYRVSTQTNGYYLFLRIKPDMLDKYTSVKCHCNGEKITDDITLESPGVFNFFLGDSPEVASSIIFDFYGEKTDDPIVDHLYVNMNHIKFSESSSHFKKSKDAVVEPDPEEPAVG